jgi:hypothetical protein
MIEHVDPRGFKLMRPQSWTVSAGDDSRIWVYDSQSPSFVMMGPRFARGDLVAWVRNELLQGEAWVRQIESVAAEPVSRNVARAGFAVLDSRGARLRLNALAVRHGDVATVFIAAADRQGFAATLPTLSAILNSVRFGGEQQVSSNRRNSRAQLQYEPWRDPLQYAFTTQIPRGWRAEGGTQNVGVRALAIYRVTSPDNAIMLFAGDPNPESFVIPNPTYSGLGWTEGGRYTQEGGYTFTVLRPQSPQVMAQRQLQAMLGAQVTLTGGRQREDLINDQRELDRITGGSQTHFVDAGEFEFRTEDGRIGLVEISVTGYSVEALGGGGQWGVDRFVGFVAPTDRASEAAGALATLVGSFRLNPQWMMARRQMNAQVAQMLANYTAESVQRQQRALQERDVSNRQVLGARLDVLGGTISLVDPASGERTEVKNTSQYYFRVTPDTSTSDPTIVGSDVSQNPAPLDLREMLRVGVDVPYT